jgi:sulfonate transport system substrate-binding protein
VAFARASAAHNLTVAALEKVGLSFSDIQPVQLAPADAAAAFARGNVDAWTIWDPYYAIAEMQAGVRVLAMSKEITTQNSFYLCYGPFMRTGVPIVEAVIDELTKVAAWSRENRGELARILSDGTGVPLEAMQRAVARSTYAVTPMTDALVAEQQQVADRFLRLGLVPSHVDIAATAWRPPA